MLCFDADDTLWHNEDQFAEAHRKFAALLGAYHPPEVIERTLYRIELGNLELYGYGCKGFTLSALETAVELAGDTLSRREVSALIAIGKEMLAHPVRLLPGVRETLAQLAGSRSLGLLTKGDLTHQERKLRDSGLLGHFSRHAVIGEKDVATYRRIFGLWGVDPAAVIMVGNSLKSDILPILELGGTAVWIPYPLCWQHERAEPPADHPRFHELPDITALPALLERLGSGAA
jgi:putative hydrolase of the HAD superfamily